MAKRKSALLFICFVVAFYSIECLPQDTGTTATRSEAPITNKTPVKLGLTGNQSKTTGNAIAEVSNTNVESSSSATTNTTTTVKPTTTTTTTTTTAKPISTTTTTMKPTTTSTSTTSTVSPTTPPPTTTVTPPPKPSPSTTTIAPITTPKPSPKPDRSFDVPSFIGGIILTVGVSAISYVVYKFYKSRTDPSYRTL